MGQKFLAFQECIPTKGDNMTSQIPDEFRYNGEIYDLVGIDGTGLYSPSDFGMQPFSTCTACWRGYMMKYDCIDNKLLLVGMEVNSRDAPEVNGVKAIEGTGFFNYSYVDIGLQTKFNGTILLAKDFIQEMYVHMGFQRPMAYRTVLELEIKGGEIIKVTDLSEDMAYQRSMDKDRGARPRSPDESDVKDWITDTFSLDYDSKSRDSDQ